MKRGWRDAVSELGGTTRRRSASRDRFEIRGPSDPEPTRRAGGRERTPEETHRCSSVMDMACVRVRLRSLEFDRDSPPVARACVAPPFDRNALKRVSAARAPGGSEPRNVLARGVNPILFHFLESQTEGKLHRRFRVKKPKMLFFTVAERLSKSRRQTNVKNDPLQT